MSPKSNVSVRSWPEASLRHLSSPAQRRPRHSRPRRVALSAWKFTSWRAFSKRKGSATRRTSNRTDAGEMLKALAAKSSSFM
eukprot:scaffold1272_cov250-Pinguiococcus_pyrenoidosus.AAC.42